MKWMHWVIVFVVLEFTAQGASPTALWVDKATNQLLVTHYQDNHYQVVRTYHTTLGRVLGDKQDVNDLKTPEGIYFFTSKRLPPWLPKKCGAMGFAMNFPNPFDHFMHKTGSGIMLHGTHMPERLKKKYDSEGCIVVDNREIQEIASDIILHLTPILIFEQFDPKLLSASLDVHLSGRSFFETWLTSWKNQDIVSYMNCYHPDFVSQKKHKTDWEAYKRRLNKVYSSISIETENVLFYDHTQYSVITFTQDYRSRLHNGQWGHRSRGTKILYLVKELNQFKIIAENFDSAVW